MGSEQRCVEGFCIGQQFSTFYWGQLIFTKMSQHSGTILQAGALEFRLIIDDQTSRGSGLGASYIQKIAQWELGGNRSVFQSLNSELEYVLCYSFAIL